MPSKRWKSVEMYYCRKLGGERRGAQYGDMSGGKSDCADGMAYSAEIRHRKSVTFSMVREQVEKAEQRATPDQIPLSIVHIPGMKLEDGIVSMSWKSFYAWFVSQQESE